MRRRFVRRSAVTLVQWCVVAAAIAAVVVTGVQFVGTNTNTKMNQTASDLANPANLTQHMGS